MLTSPAWSLPRPLFYLWMFRSQRYVWTGHWTWQCYYSRDLTRHYKGEDQLGLLQTEPVNLSQLEMAEFGRFWHFESWRSLIKLVDVHIFEYITCGCGFTDLKTVTLNTWTSSWALYKPDMSEFGGRARVTRYKWSVAVMGLTREPPSLSMTTSSARHERNIWSQFRLKLSCRKWRA